MNICPGFLYNTALALRNYATPYSGTQIVPAVIGSETAALAATQPPRDEAMDRLLAAVGELQAEISSALRKGIAAGPSEW